jgi:hypothetical protein
LLISLCIPCGFPINPKKMKKIIHINKHVIAKNNKSDVKNPPITCKTYKSNDYCNEVIILGQDGKEAARLVHRPNNPLNCGAKVWIETENEVKLL